MGLFEFLNGKEDPTVPDDIKNLPSSELLYIAKENPYGWSIIKMALVMQELKNRGLA